MTPDQTGAHLQSAHRIRCEWGPTGAAAVTADVAVVVDVLSFTTTLTVAAARGIEVFPYPWRDGGAAQHALRHGATLAVGRFEALTRTDRRHVSLSPASLARADDVERLVLPSPNGSSIAFALRDSGAEVVGASLRNASAVAAYLRPVVRAGRSVVLVPAGERWPDGSLRPAVEDLWGAGAVLAGLEGWGAPGPGEATLSPEALAAVAAFRAVPSLAEALPACASGRELVERGYVDDVALAAEPDVSDVVPVLVGESFIAVGSAEPATEDPGSR